MVMELLSGNTLGQLLSARGGAMNEAEAVGITERVGEALQFVHEQNLLHRDIKPDNIIVCDDGRVMLIDFGTARETIAGQVQGHTVTVTPGYAPLEQYAKQARRGAVYRCLQSGGDALSSAQRPDAARRFGSGAGCAVAPRCAKANRTSAPAWLWPSRPRCRWKSPAARKACASF